MEGVTRPTRPSVIDASACVSPIPASPFRGLFLFVTPFTFLISLDQHSPERQVE